MEWKLGREGEQKHISHSLLEIVILGFFPDTSAVISLGGSQAPSLDFMYPAL